MAPSTPRKERAKKSTPVGTCNANGRTASKTSATWIAPKTITHPEHHHTLNHLQQVASYYAVLSASLRREVRGDMATRLQGEMVRWVKTLSRKAVIRLDTGLKRGSCARCDTVLVEGLTASVRSQASGPHGHVVKTRCGVCGTVIRRAAPDLLPRFERGAINEMDEQANDREQRGHVDPSKAKGEQVQVDMVVASNNVSQRHRRRIASIKRHVLRQTASVTTPPCNDASADTNLLASSCTKPQVALPAKPSRSQKAKQRKARIANPAPSRPTPTTTGVRHASQARLPEPRSTNSLISLSDPSIKPPPQPELDTRRQTKYPKPPRPLLPHFNDRLQGSPWDNPITRLSDLIHNPASQPPRPNSSNNTVHASYASHAFHFWQTAARSRGDHLLITGVGKNGALGSTIP